MNTQLFIFLNSFSGRSDFLDFIIVFCATYLWWLVVVGLIIYAWFSRKDNGYRKVLFVFIGAGIAYLVTYVLKQLIGEPRPILSVSEIIPLVLRTGFDSFPSGHTSFMSALATLSYSLNRRIGYIITTLAILVAVGRVVSGAHFPLDVLGGASLGVFIGIVCLKYLKHKLVPDSLI